MWCVTFLEGYLFCKHKKKKKKKTLEIDVFGNKF